MTDKELLELAAKASEKRGTYQDDWHYSSSGPCGEGFYKIDPAQIWIGNPRPTFLFWNPLTNDGDALRLAVTLRLLVNTGSNASTAQFYEMNGWATFEEPHGDANAATRRAITRAAAEIGARGPLRRLNRNG